MLYCIKMKYSKGIIFKLYSPKLNQSYVSHTQLGLERALWTLKSYAKTGRTISCTDIMLSGYYLTILAEYENITESELRKEVIKYKNKENQSVLVNPVKRKTKTQKDHYRETKYQLKLYYQNRDEILKGNALKRCAESKKLPLQRTIEAHGITQAEINACLA